MPFGLLFSDVLAISLLACVLRPVPDIYLAIPSQEPRLPSHEPRTPARCAFFGRPHVPYVRRAHIWQWPCVAIAAAWPLPTPPNGQKKACDVGCNVCRPATSSGRSLWPFSAWAESGHYSRGGREPPFGRRWIGYPPPIHRGFCRAGNAPGKR